MVEENITIMIVDDKDSFRRSLASMLRKEGYKTVSVSDGADALNKLEKSPVDIVLCDVRMPKMDGIKFLGEARGRGIDTTVIMMTAYPELKDAIEAMKFGAYDYVSKPFQQDEILLVLNNALERDKLRRENESLRKEVEKEYCFDNIIAKSDSMMRIFEVIGKIANYKSTVLITGESGTGKDLIARAIHYHSDRKTGPFVPINCSAIPETLLESELFGFVRGSFTDAKTNKKGLFEEAEGGTLFLDEIGSLPVSLQPKLLRVLQNSEVRRIGSNKAITVDVRIIAATAGDMGKNVQEGKFRDDLYYRLNVLPIAVPPLRDRPEDIPLLVQHILGKFQEKSGFVLKEISPKAMELLMKYEWKGNVRELENVLERAAILSDSDTIGADDIDEKICSPRTAEGLKLKEDEYSIKKTTHILEKELIRKALKKTKGNRTHAAKLLEISHRTLLYKIEEYKVEE